MTADEVYMKGQWAAFNRVLNLINTLEDKTVEKKVIYHAVFEMRPESLWHDFKHE